jgi:phosphomannomutase
MSAERIRFGTDGWRALRSGEFTFANVRRVAAALALHLKERGDADRGVAVAFDRRLQAAEHAREAAGVLASYGVPVRFAEEYLPTPVLSWAVRHHGMAAGLMVTASHNPPGWSGIKIKEPLGCPSSAATNGALEKLMDTEVTDGEKLEALELEVAGKRGLVEVLTPRAGYVESLSKLVDFDAVRRAGVVGFDAMYGCGAGWTDTLLLGSGVALESLHLEGDPNFGGFGPEPVEARLTELMALGRSGKIRLGVANDGDADRIAAVDERGNFFSPQRILALFAKYLSEVKRLTGCVGKSVSATSLLDLMAPKYGFDVVDLPIGFRHVGELMSQREVLMGGEESGALGIGAHLPERDGIVNALLLAEMVGSTGLGLRAYMQTIFDEFGYFTYGRRDLRLEQTQIDTVRARIKEMAEPQSLLGLPVMGTQRIDGLKFIRDDHSWLMLRPSGTEPLVRLYAEARSRSEVEELLDEGYRLSGLV